MTSSSSSTLSLSLSHDDSYRMSQKLSGILKWSIYNYPSYKRHIEHNKNINVPDLKNTQKWKNLNNSVLNTATATSSSTSTSTAAEQNTKSTSNAVMVTA